MLVKLGFGKGVGWECEERWCLDVLRIGLEASKPPFNPLSDAIGEFQTNLRTLVCVCVCAPE